MAIIYHITSRPKWEAAEHIGSYSAPSLESQGFIHFSTIDQVTRVADAVYAGQKDLVLLVVDPEPLAKNLRYEPPDISIPAHAYTGELFPHLYGVLPTTAVLRVHDFPPHEDGTFSLPAGVE